MQKNDDDPPLIELFVLDIDPETGEDIRPTIFTSFNGGKLEEVEHYLD